MSDIDVEKLYNHVQTIYEAVEYGKKLCQEDKAEDVKALLRDLNVLVDMVEAMLVQDKGHLLPLAIVCCKNISLKAGEKVKYKVKLIAQT